MNFIRNKNLCDLVAIILLYIFVGTLPFNILLFLGLLYFIEIGNGPHTTGFMLVIAIPYIVSFIIKPVILPIISIIIYKKSYNPYIKYMFQTFKLPFILFIIFSFVDIVIFLMLNYFNFFLSHILLYLTLLSITSLYLPFYIVSFFCALKYKFFNNKINRQNQ